MVSYLKNQWSVINATLLFLLLSGVALPSLGVNLAAPSTTANCSGFPRPYQANYDVYGNGKLLGISSSALSQEENGQWLYRVSTEATKGMGGLLGGEISESVRFVVEAGVLPVEQLSDQIRRREINFHGIDGSGETYLEDRK